MWDPRYGAEYSIGNAGQSIMPRYPWLFDAKVDTAVVADKLRVLKKLGVPYTDEQVAKATADYRTQADAVAGRLAAKGKKSEPDSEIVALIAYLMRLGKNLEPAQGKTASLQGGK